MSPQLARYCDEYGVSVLSSGGFDSVTTKHALAFEFSEVGSVVIFHIGDHDPSGVHMHNSLDEDLTAFMDHYGGEVLVERLAVTPDQVEALDLPTAPPKATDRRAFDGYETTQAEAIPPRVLRKIVTDAILERLDLEQFDDVLAREREIRSSLSERLTGI